ncbi:hypothetical protein E3P86_00732 [Wallemia ichthyophaga]|uniref:D-lactate dehydratase n=1 Tax=Wallemia ichthyophaga TaxID=245174 RepID=A0A4T0JIW3_WALIC|nr:hypothetical protein E3P86_00732 [Wallemia ichthyophaga]
MTKALIFISNGTEEMEFTITYDTLVRAGFQAVSAGVDISTHAVCTRGVKITPDVLLNDLSDDDLHSFNIVVVPGGGPGANTLKSNIRIQSLFQRNFKASDKLLGTICAGSLIIKSADIAKGQPITSHPSVKDELDHLYAYSQDKVVVTENLVTSRGPGTAFDFVLTLIELTAGRQKRNDVAGPMIF